MPTLPNITPEIVKAYQDELAKNASPATAKRKSISLNRFFDWASSEGHIPVNPIPETPSSNSFVITPKKSNVSTKTWATVGISVSMAVLIFIVLYELKFPIPFVRSNAQESQIQTPLNQNLTGQAPSPNGQIPANSTENSPWNLYAKLKLTDSAGTPLVGSQSVSFKLFDAASGGNTVFTSDPQTLTTDANGSSLVSLSNVPTSVFFGNNELYLEPTVGSASASASARIPISTANTPANLQGYYAGNPDTGAGPLTVPVIDSTGALNLASESPAINAKEGNLLIQGQTVTIKTADGSGGNIEINPDANGYAHFLFEGNKGNFLNAQGPNLTSGSLYYGMVPNNATGYSLIKLQSGAPKMSTKFSVDALGNTYVAGNENVVGNLTVNGITNNAYYNQTSGNFTITQNPGDFASINKTVKSGSALSDVLTLTLDERGKPATSNSDYSTLVLNRYDGNGAGAALKVNAGNAIFNGQVELGRYSSLPGAIGQGSLVFNTSDNKVYVWDGSSWVAVGTGGGSSAFDAITSGTNTTAAMVVGSGATFNFTGSGTINASNFGGLSATGGTTGQLLTSGGAGSPTWTNIASSLTAGTDISITGTTNATIADTSTLNSVTGRGASTSNTVSVGDLTSTGTTTFGGITYTWPATQTANFILEDTGGGILSWINPASAVSPFTFWDQNSGALYPKNNTVDVLIGSNSTPSAKFAFTGVDVGLPTASIAGDIAGVATFLTGDGNLSTTNAQDLVLGSSTTGNVILDSRGLTALTANGADVTIAGNETVQGTTGITESGSGAGLTFSGTGNHAISNTSAGTNLTIDAGTIGQVQIGGVSTGDVLIAGGSGAAGCTISNSTGTITCSGDLSTNSGNLTTASATANIFNTPTSLTIGGAATTFNIGPTGASGSITFSGGSGDTGCTLDGTTGNLTCSGNITTTATSGTQGFWAQNSGALYPLNNSVDLLVGSNATTSAKFAFTGVDGGLPTASIAGNIAGVATFLTGNGNLGTTNTANITLGGLTSGNIIVRPSNDTAGGNLSPGVTDVTDLGTSAALEFRNVYAQSFKQNNFQVCDISGFGCPPGSTNFWDESLGVLFPKNNTVDVLFGASGGSTATQSAKFAFTGVNSGLPTASIAGNIANVATFLTGDGNLATTNAQDLTLGGATTGLVIINSRGATALTADNANLTAAGNLTVQGTTGITESGSGAGLTFSGTGTHAIANSSGGTNLTIDAGTSGQVQIGGISTGDVLLAGGALATGCTISNATGTITCAGDLSTNSGNLTTIAATGNVFNSVTTLNLGTTSATTVSIGSGTGTTTINNGLAVTGNSNFNGDTTIGNAITDNITFTGRAASSLLPITDNLYNLGSNLLRFANIYGVSLTQGLANNQVCDSSGFGCPSGSTFWAETLGALFPTNASVDLLIGAPAGATSSAKFAFTGVNSGLPTASIAGDIANVATYLTGDGNLSTTNAHDLTLGGVNTGNVIINSRGATNALVADGANLTTTGTFTLPNSNTLTGIPSFTEFSNGVQVDSGALTTTSIGTATVFNTNATTLDIGGAATTINLQGASNAVFNIGNSGGTTAVNITSGTGPQTFTSSNVTGTGASASFAYRDSAVTSGDLIYAKAGNPSTFTGNFLKFDNNVTTEFTVDSAGNVVAAGNLNVNGGTIFTAAGNLSLQPAGAGTTANVQIGAGGAGSTTPDLLVLDIKSDAGDPTGTNGAMYYNATTNKMRCFQASAWADCGSGSSVSPWVLDAVNGVIYPTSQTADVLIGGTATVSAKFAFTGVDGGLPTASIAGNIANVATYLTGNGNLSTTNAQDLTLGGINTGNVIINSRGSNALTADGANLTTTGTFTFPNLNTLTGVAGYLQNSLGFSVGGTTTYHFDQNGDVNVHNLSVANTVVSSLIPGTTDTYNLGSSALVEWNNIWGKTIFQNGNQVCDSSGAGCVGGGGGFWAQTNGALYPINNTVDVLFGASAGLTATQSAKFAFTGINTGLPTASIAGDIANVATYLTGDGTLSTTNAHDLTLGSLNTGNVIINSRGTNTLIADGTNITVAGNLNSSAATAALFNTTTTNLSIGGAATTVSIGASSGTTTINNPTLTLGGNSTINGGTGPGGTLTLVSTTNASKGNIQFFSSNNTIDPNGNLTLAGTISLPFANTLTGITDYTEFSNGISVGGGTTYYFDKNGNINAAGLGMTSLTDSGTASISGTLTVGNGVTNVIQSPFGPLTLAYKSGPNAWTTGITLVDTTGNVIIAQNLAVNGGSITTNQTTANLFNDTATTLNVGGAATVALNLGVGTSAFAGINIGTGNGGNTINIATGTGADAVNIATGGTSADTITLGNTGVATTLTLNSGVTTGAAQTISGTLVNSGSILALTAGTALTTGAAINIGASTYAPAGGATGNLINISAITDAAANTSGNSVVSGVGIASTLNTTGATGTKEFNAFDALAPTISGCSGGACTWSGLKVNTLTSGATGTLTSYGVNIAAAGIGAGTLTGLNISGITAGAGTQTGIAIGSGWNTDLAFASVTPKISTGDGGTISFTDGTNNLVQIVDEGTTGRLAVSNSLSVGTLTTQAYSVFGTGTTNHTLSGAGNLVVTNGLEVHGILYLDGGQINDKAGGTDTIDIPITDHAAVNTFNTLENGAWLINNNDNPGIAALMVNQKYLTPDIFDASSSGSPGTNRFRIENDGTTVITTSHDSTTASLVVSDSTGTGNGKITAGTVDPAYTINGTKYATFLPGITGVKEETAGNITTGEYVPGVGYRSVIDFNNLPEGSDLWLFGKATNIKADMSKLVALLTPSSPTRVWYQTDTQNSRLVIYSASPTEISYRLTGPRFDAQNFPNQRPAQDDIAGFVINSLDSINSAPIIADVQDLSGFVVTKIADGVYSLKDSSGNVVDGVESIGNFVAANVKAGAVTTQELATNSFTAFQGTVDNLLVRSGLVASNIQTALISPIPGGTSVTVKLGIRDEALGTSEEGKLSIQNASGQEVSSLDSQGNATFSGTVHSQNIDQIQAMLNQVATDQSVLLAATSSADMNSTASATIAELISNNLYVTGQAAINSLSVTRSLTVGTDLVFSSAIDQSTNRPINSINTLSGPLKIQSLALAPIEIMNGLVTIDTKGNVQISGDLNVAGRMQSSGLTLISNQPINQSTSSASLLSLQDKTGTQVADVNASGSAQFNSLTTPQLIVAASDATTAGTITNGVISTNSTIGQAAIPSGTTDITIKNPKVTDYSMVYVTPTSSTNNNVLYIKSKQNGQFVVGFDNPVPADVSFNWWIVQTQ